MIVELPLGETRRGSAGEPVDLGNERFLRAVAGGEFLIRHRTVTAMVEPPRPVRPQLDDPQPDDWERVEPEPTCSLLLRATRPSRITCR
ncbi:hypothetical protein ACFV1W_24430 [Kitasatospora sp. NPDC059648]|uniref:hypothetical protein n=1 Tax=Kitasatospora sp. NPDC059648 TaxID=3346894 RepID=UPI0036D16856